MPFRFFILLTSSLTAVSLSAEQPEASPVPFKPLAGYKSLWTRSLFTTHEVKTEVTAVEDAEWATNLQLSGWSEVDDRLSVYLYRTDTTQTFVLQQNEPAEAGVMQLVEIENAETIIDARVRVRLNGQEAWISQPKEEEAPPATPPSQRPAPTAIGGLQAPTTTDSRAALVREGVVLNAETTFESTLVKPGGQGMQPTAQPTAAGAAGAQATSGNAGPGTNAAVLMRLRERHEHLYRMFPRQDAK